MGEHLLCVLLAYISCEYSNHPLFLLVYSNRLYAVLDSCFRDDIEKLHVSLSNDTNPPAWLSVVIVLSPSPTL